MKAMSDLNGKYFMVINKDVETAIFIEEALDITYEQFINEILDSGQMVKEITQNEFDQYCYKHKIGDDGIEQLDTVLTIQDLLK